MSRCSGITAESLVRQAGLTYRQLDYWCRVGYLTPDCAGGSGYVRTFSDAEAQVARVMARLVMAGLTPAAASRVARGQDELAPGVRIQVTDLVAVA